MTRAEKDGVVRIVLFALVGMLFGLALSSSPVRAATLEEGHHLHLQIDNHPTHSAVVPRSDFTFRGRVILHDQPSAGSGKEGKTNYLRVADYSTVRQSIPLVLGPCTGECVKEFTFTVRFAEWSCGRHELRWTVNLPNTFEGNRQFTTSRSYVNLAGCSTDRTFGRPANWLGGGGGWYEGTNYAIVVQLTGDSTLRPGGRPTFRVQSDADRGCAFLNPNAHAGSMGTQLTPCTGSGLIPDSSTGRAFTIPSSASDGGKLAVLAFSDNDKHAGVYVRKLDSTPGSTMWVEWQDWWRTQGLVVP